MPVRAAATVLVALALGSGVLAAPANAAAAPDPDDQVSRAEYRAISKGMTRAQVARATHGADYSLERAGVCRVREYQGWDRDHIDVYVVFNEQRTVGLKTTTGCNEVVSFYCD